MHTSSPSHAQFVDEISLLTIQIHLPSFPPPRSHARAIPPNFVTTPRPPANLSPDCTEQGDWSYSKISMDKLGIPCFALFFCVSFLNLSLMWAYIAMRSKSMKKGKANLSNKLLISIVVISCVFGILEFVAFGILQNNTIGAGTDGSMGQGGVP